MQVFQKRAENSVVPFPRGRLIGIIGEKKGPGNPRRDENLCEQISKAKLHLMIEGKVW